MSGKGYAFLSLTLLTSTIGKVNGLQDGFEPPLTRHPLVHPKMNIA